MAVPVDRECYPSPLNYYQFPKSCCTSVNEVICHGIPDGRPLQPGDICNVDVTVFHRGFHGDLNETYLVGEVSPEARDLVTVTWQCLQKAIDIGEQRRRAGPLPGHGQPAPARPQPATCSVVIARHGRGWQNWFLPPFLTDLNRLAETKWQKLAKTQMTKTVGFLVGNCLKHTNVSVCYWDILCALLQWLSGW